MILTIAISKQLNGVNHQDKLANSSKPRIL